MILYGGRLSQFTLSHQPSQRKVQHGRSSHDLVSHPAERNRADGLFGVKVIWESGIDLALKRLLSEYVRYYHEDRTHLGLGKGTPGRRTRSVARGCVLSHERLGGLHHRYDRAA